MKKEETGRITSFDLLRVVSMLLIIAYHWQLHAYKDGIHSAPLSSNQIFSFAIGSWGTLGVDLFFMLSAYFLIRNNSVKLGKIFGLICKTSIYGMVVLSIAYAGGIERFDIFTTVKCVMGVFAYQYWFLTVYCIIYLLSPCLNFVIWNISFKFFSLIIFVLSYATFILSFIFGNEILGRTAVGISIYLTIGFLERFPQYNIFQKFRMPCGIISILVIFTLEIMLSYMGMQYDVVFYKCINRIQITQSPFMLAAGLFVFYIFKNWNLKSLKIIEFLGKYSIGAYLLHGGPAFLKHWLWDDLFAAGYFYEKSLGEYVAHYCVCIITLYFTGVVCEYIYTATLGRLIMFLLSKKIKNGKMDLSVR